MQPTTESPLHALPEERLMELGRYNIGPSQCLIEEKQVPIFFDAGSVALSYLVTQRNPNELKAEVTHRLSDAPKHAAHKKLLRGLTMTTLVVWALLLAASAFAQDDPFAEPGTQTGTSAAMESPLSAGAAVAAACQHITKAVCHGTNKSLLLTSLSYVVVMVVLLSLVRFFWNRRGTSTALVRFLVTMGIAAGVAGALVYFDPLRGQDLGCCLASAVFKSEIHLQDSAAGRASLFGVIPSAVLFVVVGFVSNLVTRR